MNMPKKLPELSKMTHEEKDEMIRLLFEAIIELRGKASKNSRNSNNPPSSDGLGKQTKSLREKSNKSPGAQKGHKGTTLKMTETPDHVVTHKVGMCNGCGLDLHKNPSELCTKAQVFEIPEPEFIVTEHRVEQKTCPSCRVTNKGTLPEGVFFGTQYGARSKSLIVYLNQYQLLPYNRIREFFGDVFGQTLSEGVVFKANKACFDQAESTENNITSNLIDSKVIHVDETGLRVNGELHWLHACGTESHTKYTIHPKRGKEGIDKMDILPQYKGMAVHDHWKSYFSYTACQHVLCNAHHLRELKFVAEQLGQDWANQMMNCLILAKDLTQKYLKKGEIPPAIISDIEMSYDRIIQIGLAQNPLPKKIPKKRGRIKKGKVRCLLERLRDFKSETLSFMMDFDIPFDNNLGERDIRMSKVKQKISGSFRSNFGAQMFCRIRGYISTARKQNLSAFESIYQGFTGNPLTFSTSQ